LVSVGITPCWRRNVSFLNSLPVLLQLRKLFKSVSPVERKVGYTFSNKELLRIALTHRSKCKINCNSYERLEFLGDAVLELIVSDYLFHKYRKKTEGELTVLRSILVNRKSLYEVGLSMDILDACIVDRSLDIGQLATRRTILSSIIESIIGAVYLDGGLKSARKIVYRWIIHSIDELDHMSSFNYKGQLFEICHKLGRELPLFRTLDASGPDHEKTYTVAVYIGSEQLGAGKGTTKRAAEQRAAKQAFDQLRQSKLSN